MEINYGADFRPIHGKKSPPCNKKDWAHFFHFFTQFSFFFIIFLGEGGRNLFGAGQILGISHPN